jgi:hypothetical protein
MKWRVLCAGECNIRVDLLALYPALVVLSVLAAVSGARDLATTNMLRGVTLPLHPGALRLYKERNIQQ